MRRFVLHSALLTMAVVAFSISHPVQAQGLLDQGKSLLGGGKDPAAGTTPGAATGGGFAGIAGALPRDKIVSLLQRQGYTNIKDLAPSSSRKMLQASATNSSGKLVNLLINPTTGGVVSALAK